MPTYDYVCVNCGHRFEKFQKMSDEPLKFCPECGGKVKRLIGTGGGIVFKGHGFYATDYGSSSCCGNTNPCENPKRCCENR
ncbi:zinc ribbon domain-containing protein [candidate division KSB1 bacterium]|nr:MAG: zinc ribbon domain-containing protein [candidate division KSB1 bacterium]